MGGALGEVESDALEKVEGYELGEGEGNIEGDLEGLALGLSLGLADGNELIA